MLESNMHFLDNTYVEDRISANHRMRRIKVDPLSAIDNLALI